MAEHIFGLLFWNSTRSWSRSWTARSLANNFFWRFKRLFNLFNFLLFFRQANSFFIAFCILSYFFNSHWISTNHLFFRFINMTFNNFESIFFKIIFFFFCQRYFIILVYFRETGLLLFHIMRINSLDKAMHEHSIGFIIRIKIFVVWEIIPLPYT